MKSALRTVLNELDAIASTHPEVTDTEVRERIGEVVENILLRPVYGYLLPHDFGMFRRKGDRAVRAALAVFLRDACAALEAAGLETRADRLKALQDDMILSDDGNAYHEYFGRAANVADWHCGQSV